MAINKEVAVSDGIQHKTTPPILVFNKAYVNLYDMASILNYRIDWIEAEIGYFKVTANDKSYDFTLILQYDDLMSQNRRSLVQVKPPQPIKKLVFKPLVAIGTSFLFCVIFIKKWTKMGEVQKITILYMVSFYFLLQIIIFSIHQIKYLPSCLL
jgi:hypothetical protein